MIVILFGPSGAGKSTVGAALSRQLGWRCVDADSFHSEANVAKLSAGVPLTDSDRESWLDSLAVAIQGWDREDDDVVLACSALKRKYRQRLGRRPALKWVYLKISLDEARRRLAERRGHFSSPAIAASQFGDLEEPGPDEDVLALDAGGPVETIVADIVARLGLESGQRE